MEDSCSNPGGRNHVYPGMAHFPGTGPDGTHCAGCGHFRKDDDTLGRCLKFSDMARIRSDKAPKIRGLCRSCKYYLG
jgi:hypothetical protein